MHERARAEPYLRPERFAIGLEHGPSRAAQQALLQKQRHAPHRNILPRRAAIVVTGERPRTEYQRAAARKAAHAIDCTRTKRAIFGVADLNSGAACANHVGLGP